MTPGAPPKKVTTDDVLEAVMFRDRREYPVLTVSQLADMERFDDVTRRTIQRKVNTLVDEDRLRERQLGKVGIYWLPENKRGGECAACGGMIVPRTAYSDTDTPTSYDAHTWNCTRCNAQYQSIRNPDGSLTSYGGVVTKAIARFSWWQRIGTRTQKAVEVVAKRLFNAVYSEEDYPEIDHQVATDGFANVDESDLQDPPDGVVPEKED
jgi:hypothetical protein